MVVSPPGSNDMVTLLGVSRTQVAINPHGMEKPKLCVGTIIRGRALLIPPALA